MRIILTEVLIEQRGYRPMLLHNRLFDQGELLVVRTVYRAESVLPASFYGRLYNDTPSDADLLADLQNEMSGNGYAALSWTRGMTDWGAAAIVGGQAQSVGVKKTFTATGAGYGPATALVFATSSDGSGVPFSWFLINRTITPSTPLDVTPYGIFRGEAA